MSQLSKVAKYLRRHAKGAGISVEKLARKTGLTRDAIYRRVYDLRMNEGKVIYSNVRNVGGHRTTFYRIAA